MAIFAIKLVEHRTIFSIKFRVGPKRFQHIIFDTPNQHRFPGLLSPILGLTSQTPVAYMMCALTARISR